MLNKKLSVFFFVLLALIFGGLSSSNTGDDLWYQSLIKSELNPPGFVFGIVWPVLYLLMAISAYRVFDSIAKLFMAGILPGIMIALLFMSYVVIWSILNKNLMPKNLQNFSLSQKIKGSKIAH